MAATITPPGQGRIIPCRDRNGISGRDCLECHGEGRSIRRVCPLCCDPGWDYVNGTDDRDGMACRISRGYRWAADDLGVACPSLAQQGGVRSICPAATGTCPRGPMILIQIITR